MKLNDKMTKVKREREKEREHIKREILHSFAGKKPFQCKKKLNE
jgi:hypothetical protein